MANPPLTYVTKKRQPIQVFIQSSVLTLEQDGNDVAGAVADDFPGPTSEHTYKPNNRVVEAFGKVFFIYLDTIRERDEGGAGNWGTVFTLTAAPNQRISSGLQVVHVDGEERVALMYWEEGPDNMRVVHTADGTTWTDEIASSTAGTRILTGGTAISYQSSILWLVYVDAAATDTVLSIYDFDLQAYTGIVSTGASISSFNMSPKDVYVYQNRIFVAADSNSPVSNQSSVLRLDGSTFTILYRSDEHRTGSSVNYFVGGGYKVLFADPDTGDLMLISNKGGPLGAVSANEDAGLYCIRFTGDVLTDSNWLDSTNDPSDLTDIAATVMPSKLTSINDGGSHESGELSVVEIFTDTITTPGTPVIFIVTAERMYATDTESWYWWQWNGVSTQMSSIGISEAIGASHVISKTNVGGGARTPARGNARPYFDGGAPEEVAGNRTKVFFRVEGSGSAVNLQIYYNSDSEAPDALINLGVATVTVESGSPSTTPTNTSTTINSVTPDAGATLYSIELETGAAGILGGQGVSLQIVPV